MVEARSKDGKGLVIEVVFPFNVRVAVAVFISRIVIQVELVTAHITHEVQGIFPINDMADMHIGIIKTCLAVTVNRIWDQAEQPV